MLRFLTSLCMLVLFGVWIGPAEGQVLSRSAYPLWDESYENYGTSGYRDYLFEADWATYDPFGTRLLNGVDLFRIEEFRRKSPFAGSTIYKSQLYGGLFRNLVLTRDTIGGWSNALMVGDAIRTQFTPLTLYKARVNGLRWDTSSRKSRFTVLASRVTSPVQGGRPPQTRRTGTYLYGGHWETTLGDVLVLGMSYVNAHHFDSRAGRPSGSQKGVIPSDLEGPTSVCVIITDDSPGDGQGPLVYDVRAFADGRPVEELPEARLIRGVLDMTPDTFRDLPIQIEDVPHLRQSDAWLRRTVQYSWLFSTAQGKKGMYFTDGVAVSLGREPVRVNGTDVLVVRFEIPEGARSMSFKALVADDYAIDVAAGFPFIGSTEVWGDWYTVSRAEGNPRDRSNLGWVSFGYGFRTGLAVTSLNATVDLWGIVAQGEWATSLSYGRFPSPWGQRSTEKTDAYFVRARRNVASWRLGGEVFHIPAEYRTALPYWPEAQLGTKGARRFELVDDNDDSDEWPDPWEHWDPLDEGFRELSQTRSATDEAKEHLDPSPGGVIGYGVFPGLDRDRDGTPDFNVNANSVPDYVEPFLAYYVEPDDFVYGDDLNNNGVPDERENDNRPDYPYDLDSRGAHGFVSGPLTRDLRIRSGAYAIQQPRGGGETRVTYGKAAYNRTGSEWGKIGLYYTFKRVRDTMSDDVYEYAPDPLAPSMIWGNSAVLIRRDELAFRNSFYHLLFLTGHISEGTWSRVPGLTLKGALRLERNDQRAVWDRGRRVQDGGDVTRWGWMAKGKYRWSWGRLTLMPMTKYIVLNEKRSQTGGFSLGTRHLIPILRADYRVGTHSMLRAGVQGFPFLKERFRNLSTPGRDYDAMNTIVLLENRGSYAGYTMGLLLGYQRTRYRYFNQSLFRDQTNVSYFARVFVE